MQKIFVGNLVRFRCDKSQSVYKVLAVSDIYDMAKLENAKTHQVVSWYPLCQLLRVGYYQPDFIYEGV